MKKTLFILMILAACLGLQGQKVVISGNQFTVDGKTIWFNGINTPWHKFVDFGRADFEAAWWEGEFARYADNHINLARVWIHCSGEVSPDIDANGYVSGASALFWEHMDKLFEASRTHQVYLLPALFSFDITKQSYSTSAQWRAFIQDPANIQSYIDNVLIPLVQRYEDEPYLLGWEICNEPEWMFENSEHGPQSFADVQRFHALLAAAIHNNSNSYVTTGSAAPKWNSPIYDSWGENEGNMFSDAALRASGADTAAFLDFYQYHWYPWQSEWMASPFTQTTAAYEVDDRPVIVGESEGNDVCDAFVCMTVSEMYENAYLNGFDGVCAWKTPQNDGHGTFENIAAATNAFHQKYPGLVYPDGGEQPEEPEDPEESHSLSVLVEGNGRVEIAPEQSSYPDGTEVILKAFAQDGFRFSYWSGDWSGEAAEVRLIMNKDLTVTAHFEVLSGEIPCSNPQTISLPFTFDGVGSHCWVTDQAMAYINSWNLDVLKINGVDYTNTWSNSLPAPLGGKYYIEYSGAFPWSHFEAPQLKVSTMVGEIQEEALALSSNPFDQEFSLNLRSFRHVERVVVSDLQGRVWEEFVHPVGSTLTLGRPLSSGPYILLLQADGHKYSFKLIKR